MAPSVSSTDRVQQKWLEEQEEDAGSVLKEMVEKVDRLWYCPGMPGAVEARRSFELSAAKAQA